MNYLNGLLKAGEKVKNSEFEQEFSILEQRMLDILREEQRYGPTDITRNQKSYLIEDLNQIVLTVTKCSFNSFCH